MSDSPILGKVRKLLAKTTEANCTPAEADSAFAMASRLLAEYNLTMADVAKSGSPTDEVYVEEFTFRTGRWQAIHNLACSIVEEFCYVKGVFHYSQGKQRKVKQFYLFGLRDNVDMAKFMFSSLLASFDCLWDNYRARTFAPLSDKYSFMSGVAEGFSSKMRDERAKFSIEEDAIKGEKKGSTEIVLTGVVEKTLVNFQEKYPKIKNTYVRFGVSDNSTSAKAEGYREGRKLSLRRGLEDKS